MTVETKIGARALWYTAPGRAELRSMIGLVDAEIERAEDGLAA